MPRKPKMQSVAAVAKGWLVEEMVQRVGDFRAVVSPSTDPEYPDHVSWHVWGKHSNYVSVDADGSPGIVHCNSVEKAMRDALACARAAKKKQLIKCDCCNGRGHIEKEK